MQRIEKVFAGRRLIIETGRMAKQAAGSAVVTFGDTMVLAAVTVSDKESTLPFFPLLVEYREKTYAAGKIPGGFIKREGRPHDHEILAARIIDRSIRPLFPEGFRNEVQVYVYVISGDQENDSDVLGLVAASYALTRPARFRGTGRSPAFASAASRTSGSSTRPSSSSRTATWSSSSPAPRTRSTWSKAAASKCREADVLEALTLGHKGIKELIGFQQELLKAAGSTPKMAWTKAAPPADLVARVKADAEAKIVAAINQKDKHTRVAGGRGSKEGRRRPSLVGREARSGPTLVGAQLEEIEYNALRSQVLDTGQARRRPVADRSPRDFDRHQRAARVRTVRRCSRAARRRRSCVPR